MVGKPYHKNRPLPLERSLSSRRRNRHSGSALECVPESAVSVFAIERGTGRTLPYSSSRTHYMKTVVELVTVAPSITKKEARHCSSASRKDALRLFRAHLRSLRALSSLG